MPRCKMVVYYMRDDEMVADDTTFDVQDILENEVRWKRRKGWKRGIGKGEDGMKSAGEKKKHEGIE